MAHGYRGHSDRTKELVVDWLVGLGAAGAAGAAVSGGAAVGNAATSSSARTGSTFGAAAGLTSGVGMGSLTAANLVASHAAATAATAASSAAQAAANAQQAYLVSEVTSAALAGAASQTASLQPLADTAAATSATAKANADAAAAAAATAQADADAAATKAKNSKWVTPILDIANVMHMSLNLLNGFNAPNKGDALGGAADKLALAAKDLELAANTSGWAGDDGEPTYTDANKAQLARVKSMAGIDKAFKEVLTTQAEDVLDLREVFGYVTGSFAIWKPVLGLMSTYGGAWQTASLSLQGIVGTALLATDTSHQGLHHQKAVANSAAILGCAADYRNL
jgi:hypothetical protein